MPAATEAFTSLSPKIAPGGPGQGAFPPDPHDGGPGGGDPGSCSRVLRERAYYTGIAVGIAGIVMLFSAFVSSYIVRRGLAGDWVALELPGILWFNSVLLLASSAALELARRGMARRNQAAFRTWWLAATGLGLAFLAGQVAGWNQLWARGVFQDTNPSHSFFYLLTFLHALHLGAGLGALCIVALRFPILVVRAGRSIGVDLAAIYWHFLDVLWVLLFLMLWVWR